MIIYLPYLVILTKDIIVITENLNSGWLYTHKKKKWGKVPPPMRFIIINSLPRRKKGKSAGKLKHGQLGEYFNGERK